MEFNNLNRCHTQRNSLSCAYCKYYTSRWYPNINMNKNNSNRLIEYKKKYYFWAIQDKYQKCIQKKRYHRDTQIFLIQQAICTL